MSLVTVFAVLNWFSILLCYFSFRRGLKAQGILDSELPFRGVLQDFGAVYALVLVGFILVFQGMFVSFGVMGMKGSLLIEELGYDAFIPKFSGKTFVLKDIGLFVFGGNFLWWKWWKGTKRVRALEMDLVTHRSRFEKEEEGKAHVLEVPWWKAPFQRAFG